ncbi:MAG: NAD(P)/FAD-dependent oxidoreductase [Candidatus Krumholzibacteriota bacterium]|nr:NAD(P)/FAD-dependent oxidoreductase [Candidatus Krumholzibacteriota bacterium]
MRPETFDVIVIGAGPAGSRAAERVASRGHSVLLIEKRGKIGTPVRCAEAIGPVSQLEELMEIDKAFVSSVVNGITVVSPKGRSFDARMPRVGMILDRTKFDEHLAASAVKAGAVLRTSHQAVGLIRKGEKISGVKIIDLSSGARYSAVSFVVIGADGVESLSPRWAGLKQNLTTSDMLVCAQETIEGIDVEKKFIEFHLGYDRAPGGYAWVFPKTSSSANLGVGISPLKAGNKTALEYLNDFLEYRSPGGKRQRQVIGACEVAKELPSLAVDGYVVVGEAANQNNPLSGGGILSALIAADTAAESVAEAVEAGTGSYEILNRYSENWKRSEGTRNDLFYKAAQVFYSLNDRKMEKALKKLSREPGLLSSLGADPARIVRSLLLSSPSLAFGIILSILKEKNNAGKN